MVPRRRKAPGTSQEKARRKSEPVDGGFVLRIRPPPGRVGGKNVSRGQEKNEGREKETAHFTRR